MSGILELKGSYGWNEMPKEERFEGAVKCVYDLPMLEVFCTKVEMAVWSGISRCNTEEEYANFAQEWIDLFENTEDVEKKSLAYDIVNLLLGELCAREIHPISENLLTWHGDVSRGKIVRPSAPRGRPNQKHRDKKLQDIYKQVVKVGFPRSRNLRLGGKFHYFCCLGGGSAIDVIGVAIQKVTKRCEELKMSEALEDMGPLKCGKYKTLDSILRKTPKE